MKTIAAIDPGSNGGIAWRDANGIVHCANMPESLKEKDELFADIQPSYVYLEKTGEYMPGNSGPAAVTFARHCGQLEGLLVGCGVPFEAISPQVWQKMFGALPKAPKNATAKQKAEAKRARKNAIKDAMQRRYPDLKITLNTADALALLTWGLRVEE